MRETPPISFDGLRVKVIDAFGNKHPIAIKPEQSLLIGNPFVPPNAKVSS
jgi:hypothetical protein